MLADYLASWRVALVAAGSPRLAIATAIAGGYLAWVSSGGALAAPVSSHGAPCPAVVAVALVHVVARLVAAFGFVVVVVVVVVRDN